MSLDTFRQLLNGDIDLNARRSRIRLLAGANRHSSNPDSLPGAPDLTIKGTVSALASAINSTPSAGLLSIVEPGPTRCQDELLIPGLPFDGVMYAELTGQANPTDPFVLDALIGMSPRQFIGNTTGKAKRDFSQIRKIAKQIATKEIPEDLYAFSIGAGLHSRRIMLVTDFLQGKSPPVLEFALIDHWMKLAGASLPASQDIIITGDLLAHDYRPDRLIVLRKYQEMLLPILDDLRRLPRDQQLNPNERAWAIFNAWWAIASLYGDASIIVDASPLWPEAMALLDHTAEAVRGVHGYCDLVTEAPRYPVGSFEELEFIKTYSAAGACTPDLISNWDILEKQLPVVIDNFDTIAATRAQRAALARRRHREAVLNTYNHKRRRNDACIFSRLAKACGTVDLQIPGIAALSQVTGHFAKLAEHMDAAPEKRSLEIHHPDATPAGDTIVSTMLTWLSDADLLLRSIEVEVEAWNDALIQAAETEGSLTDRMAASRKASDAFTDWQAKSHDALSELVERGCELPWLGAAVYEIEEEGGGTELPASDGDGNTVSPEIRIEALEEALDRAESQAKQHRHRARVLEQQLERSGSKGGEPAPATQGSSDLLVALREYSESHSCQSVLKLLQAAHPERLRVLPSAIDSASEADSTLSTNSLLRKVHALVVDGWDILAAERPPYDMQNVIPCELALNESDTTRADARCMLQRTFQEKHQDGSSATWEMSWHLKLDHRHRLYFAWDAESEQIVIGHAGAHLGLAAVRS